MEIAALDELDARRYRAVVAGPAALLIAKLHNIAERAHEPSRINDKDAHDVYRLLVTTETSQLANRIRELMGEPISRGATNTAVEHWGALFAAGPGALGSEMAGRAEGEIGDPENVSLSVSLLASDVVEEVHAEH